MHQEKTISVAECIVPGGLVLGGFSRLLDAWSRSPLVAWAPSFIYHSYCLQFSFREETSSFRTNKKWPLSFLKRKEQSSGCSYLSPSQIYFDCRFDTSANIAHVLQNQIAVALRGLEAFDMLERREDLLLLVRRETPDYAIRLFNSLGFNSIVSTDEEFFGWRLKMAPEKFPFRPLAAPILRRHAVCIGLLSDRDIESDPVFLSRRGSRKLINSLEIDPIFNRGGYRTMYPEDLSPEEQIRQIANARSIVGLHGAGFGHLYFRDTALRGTVVEIFPSGYPTNWVRANCSLTNDFWIGGMGDFDAIVMKDNLMGRSHPRTHEARDYRLDPSVARTLLKLLDEAEKSPRQLQYEDMLALIEAVKVSPNTASDQ